MHTTYQNIKKQISKSYHNFIFFIILLLCYDRFEHSLTDALREQPQDGA